jgi:hypothetical protein
VTELLLCALFLAAPVLAYKLGRVQRFPPSVLKLFPEWYEAGPLHSHRWDTMLDDGLGWRCGICGQTRKEAL